MQQSVKEDHLIGFGDNYKNGVVESPFDVDYAITKLSSCSYRSQIVDISIFLVLVVGSLTCCVNT